MRGLGPMTLRPLPAHPLVSVLVSNHDYAGYVGTAVASALSQGFKNLEVIVVDDGSTDGSPELLRRITASESRVRLIEQANAGQAAALNRAFEESHGEIVCLLDADDTFDSGKVAAVVAAFASDRRAGFCVHSLRPVDSTGQPLGPPVPRRLESGWIAETALSRGGKTGLPPTSGMALRRQVAEAILPAPPALRICADGYWRESAQMITSVAALPSPLGAYRLHGANRRGGSRLEVAALRRVIEEEYPLIHGTVRAFLGRYYGPEVMDRMRLEDAPGYWEKVLLLRILDDTYATSSRRAAAQILARLPGGARRQLLSLLTRLPGLVSRPAARFLFGDVPARRKLLSALCPARLLR